MAAGREDGDDETVVVLRCDGTFDTQVKGESHYQDALWQLAGGRTTDYVREPISALLTPEPENPYDANAIRVSINGLRVGYLSRETAVLYRPGLINLMRQNGNRPRR